jgi:hypothetical protein
VNRRRLLELAAIAAWLTGVLVLTRTRIRTPATVHAPSWSCVQRGDTLHCREDRP